MHSHSLNLSFSFFIFLIQSQIYIYILWTKVCDAADSDIILYEREREDYTKSSTKSRLYR